jgi:hypothetical protein
MFYISKVMSQRFPDLKNAVSRGITPCGIQDPHGVTSQKMAFFIVSAMKTSNLMFPNCQITDTKGKEETVLPPISDRPSASSNDTEQH